MSWSDLSVSRQAWVCVLGVLGYLGYLLCHFREGKLINRSLSEASAASVWLCWLKSVTKWMETKELAGCCFPMMPSGSGQQQNLANVCRYFKIWARPPEMWRLHRLLKCVLQDVLLRGRPGDQSFSDVSLSLSLRHVYGKMYATFVSSRIVQIVGGSGGCRFWGWWECRANICSATRRLRPHGQWENSSVTGSATQCKTWASVVKGNIFFPSGVKKIFDSSQTQIGRSCLSHIFCVNSVTEYC